MQEKIERYQRYNNTGYNLEPDLKQARRFTRFTFVAGWHCCHTEQKFRRYFAFWFYLSGRILALQESQLFLFKVRFALHLILRRYDNRLLFDRQLKIEVSY